MLFNYSAVKPTTNASPSGSHRSLETYTWHWRLNLLQLAATLFFQLLRRNTVEFIILGTLVLDLQTLDLLSPVAHRSPTT